MPGPIEEGDEFADFKAFKAAMADWSITGEHKFTRGRPQTARLTAGEQRGRAAAWNGALQNIPDRVQHCSRCGQEGHNVLHCPAIPAGL